MKIAVIQTAFPGDVILSTPIFQALKDKYIGCKTVAVVRPESVCLLQNNPYIDTILPYDKYGSDSGISGILRIASKLKGCDQAIIIQRHFRSALLSLLAGIKERVGFDNSSSEILYAKKVKYQKDHHEVQRCLELIGIDNIDKRYSPRIFLDNDVNARAEKKLLEAGINSDFAVVAPGSVWATKRYAHYLELTDLIANKLNLKVVMVGGISDSADAEYLASNAQNHPVNLVGKTDLLESAAIISKAKIAFTNDSAPAHIAAAVGTPVVAIFGPTSPSFGFSPYSEKSRVVDIGNLYCRPCTIHGSKKCPEKHFRCMIDLQPEVIIEAAKSLLS